MTRHTILLALLCSLMSVRAASLLPAGTLTFRFSLHGQTRTYDMRADAGTDSLTLHWSMPRHGVMLSGAYVMGRESLDAGEALCLMQPEDGARIRVPRTQTAFVLSRKALQELRATGHTTYGRTHYELADSLPCAGTLPSLHVTDSVEGCDMWIINSMELPVIWKMENNPLEIDWVITNVEKAYAAAGGRHGDAR